jgi:hypothetical protein
MSQSTSEHTLHHVHLPTMSEAGLVRYDPRARRVEALDAPAERL